MYLGMFIAISRTWNKSYDILLWQTKKSKVITDVYTEGMQMNIIS